MTYLSTRNHRCSESAAAAITRGIAPDGGLFVPDSLPPISQEMLASWLPLDYRARAAAVLALFLTDFSHEELTQAIDAAYGANFDHPAIAPLRTVGSLHFLELWHGPTCAFKDMALQLLPHLMTRAAAKRGDTREIVILTATSGDTGKAALAGFRNVPGTRILVYYPKEGVSPIQRLQMVTEEGDNVGVCAVEGNFDDTQTGVKRIFSDWSIAERLDRQGMVLSSANSINWGRLVPQIVYYFHAYLELVAAGSVSMGERINVCVPTGNFGNILAAYYARGMGLPIGRLICASNANRVLTDFFQSGSYDRNRPFYTTISPSMDILISSNLERLLFDLCGRNDRQLAAWMESLRTTGHYTVPDAVCDRMRALFAAGTADENATRQAIREVFEREGYLCDPHTAVAVRVYEDYRQQTGDRTPAVIVSTANPYKFAGSVLQALGADGNGDEFERIDRLHRLSGLAVPSSLADLRCKPERFGACCTREGMENALLAMLGIGS